MKKNKKHWLVVTILCGFTACFSIPINLSGVFLSPVATELGFQRGDFSFHATLTLFISAIVSLYVPRLMEKIPLKYILILAALLSGIPNIMMGFADKLWEFNLWGSVRGVGVGLISMVPGSTAAARRFISFSRSSLLKTELTVLSGMEVSSQK